MARVRLPAGLALPEGVYDHADVRLASDWVELREVDGVELECKRHLDQWWPTAGLGIELRDLQTWYCPRCAWSFRQSLGGRGGTPQF